MPHKRPARPTWRQDKARRASNLPPKISVEHEPIPKSASRVLNAGRIRQEYRKKKRRLDGVENSDEEPRRTSKKQGRDDDETPALRIKPDETVAQFNRRVENRMMPCIKAALQQSSAQVRRVRREEAQEASEGCRTSKKGSDPFTPPADDIKRPRDPVKEFQATLTSIPRRLNDVAQEPPVIKKFPRGMSKNDAGPPGVPSLAQKAMMEEERDKAIRHYRELKARKAMASGSTDDWVGRSNELP